MNKKILVLLCLLLVAGVGSGVYFMLQDRTTPAPTIDVPGGQETTEDEAPEKPPATSPLPEPAPRTPAPPPPAPLSPDRSAESGLEVAGVVRDDSGVPVAGMTVTLVAPWSFDGSLPKPEEAFDLFRKSSHRLQWPRTRSREDGTFLIQALKSGSHLLFSGPPTHGEGWKRVRVTADRPVRGVELIVPRGLKVRGRVVEVPGEAGVAGVVVSAVQGPSADATFKGRRVRETITEADGGFLLLGFQQGRVEVSLHIRRDSFLEVEGSPLRRVEAGGGEVEFRLHSVGIVEFRAEDESGAPLLGPIQVRVPGPARGGLRPTVSLDGPGAYTL
ncbi:MAG: hypothetical protein ACYTFG_20270, partial [Planctomycetota bacterium]